MAYDLYDFTESLAQVDVAREDITAVIYAAGCSPEGYGSWEGGFYCALKDGRHVLVHGWCDTTGWGCQDGAYLERGEFDQASFLQFLQEKYSYGGLDENDVDVRPADLNRWINGEIEGGY